MTSAARERDDVAALVTIAAPSTNGSVIVLEQQKHVLDRMKMDEAERKSKIALQERINAAVLGTGTWDDVPANVRRQAETPWFQSYLAFDPGLAPHVRRHVVPRPGSQHCGVDAFL